MNTTKITHYLNDPNNFTGYSQVLEEWTGAAAGTLALTKPYTLGDDVLTQAGSGTVSHLLYDGHGSTRLLTDSSATITDVFHYDAYGVDILPNRTDDSDYGVVNTASTNLRYSGEYVDDHIRQQYLRARWYDPQMASFNRLDPFSGNITDPQSLHKYAFNHCEPVNRIDPSGRRSVAEVLTVTFLIAHIATSIVSAIFKIAGPKVSVDLQNPGGNWWGFFNSFSLAFSVGQVNRAEMLVYGTGCKKWVSLTTWWIDLSLKPVFMAIGMPALISIAVILDAFFPAGLTAFDPEGLMDQLFENGVQSILQAGASLGLGGSYLYAEELGDLAGWAVGADVAFDPRKLPFVPDSIPFNAGAGTGATWGVDTATGTFNGARGAALGLSYGKTWTFQKGIGQPDFNVQGVVSYTWINNLKE